MDFELLWGSTHDRPKINFVVVGVLKQFGYQMLGSGLVFVLVLVFVSVLISVLVSVSTSILVM